jgi:hypothetical protein
MALTQVQGGMLAGSTNTTTTIQSNGTTAITIDSSQNVGIGTSSPTFASGTGLQVKGAAFTNVRVTSASSTGTDFAQDSSGNGYMFNRDNAALIYGTNNTERMRINSGGALLIGTTATSPATADAYGVTINSNTSGNFYAGVIQASSNGSASLLLNRGSDNGNIALFYRSAVNVGNISVTASATSYNSGSDYRLKNDIQPLTNALEKVELLKPSKWTWKADNTYGDGFVAHELAEVCPHAVTGEKDAVDADGNIIPQGVDTSFLVATLTAAIQELNAKVEAQAAEIAALKGA